MAIQKIQYTNKEQLVNDTTINDKYKCKADDLNEIKTVVNNNADEIPSGDNLVNVGTTIDTNYRMNVLYSKNLLNKETSVSASFPVDSTSEALSPNQSAITSAWIPCKPNTTYTLGGQYNRQRWQTKAANGTITYVGQDSTTITTNSTAAWLRIYYWYNDGGGTISPNAIKAMLVEGTGVPSEYIPYITPSINIDGEEIYNANLMNYDTTERVIGTYNGKPLYRKMFVYTNLTTNTNNNFDWNSTNIIVNIYGIVIGDSGFRTSLNAIFGSDLTKDRTACYYAASTNKLRSYCGSNLTGNNIYNTNIVVEYTKTTD